MSGNFIYRHHVEPRVKLYSPREESFPIPLKYVDVSRTTQTNLDVMQESRIDDYWNIDGSRDFVWFVDRFHSVHSIKWETSRRICVFRGETVKTASDIQARPFYGQNSGRNWEEPSWGRSKNGQLKKQKLENARRLRRIYFIDPEDKEFKETVRNARKKLETPMAPAMPC